MCAMLLIHTPSHPAPPYSTSPHLATPSTSSHRLLRDRPHLAIINQGLLVTRGERMQDRQNGWVHRLTRKSMQQFRHHTHTHTPVDASVARERMQPSHTPTHKLAKTQVLQCCIQSPADPGNQNQACIPWHWTFMPNLQSLHPKSLCYASATNRTQHAERTEKGKTA
jgi:hypothetical protein